YAGISCGPFIGGVLVTAFGWRSLFYLCIPLGSVTFLLVRWKLRGEWADARGEPFDWRGSLLYAVAISLLVVGASNLGRERWPWGAMFAGATGLVLFVMVEARTTYPVLDVRLLRDNRVFALSNLAALLNYAATFGVTFFLSLYLQYVKGLPPRTAGTVLMVQPVIQALLSPLCGRLSDRFPADRVATAGMALCAVGLGIAATLAAPTPLPVVVFMLSFLGVGFALFSSPNTSVIMGSVPPRHLGVASGLTASMRSLGMMTSMTIITVAFSVFMGGHSVTPQTQPAFLLSMRVSLLAFCFLCGLGILCSLGRWRGLGSAGAASEGTLP
ncbi:MAG TPA: MFS transporter, partial [Deferrisomatales bacterium]|nr:MFS transporter [Deferrisomatales bacterium]